MKRKFIRALWGIHDHQGRRFYKRRSKIDDDISVMMKNPYVEPFRVYVFGKENYKKVDDLGFDAVLLDDRPIVWDMDNEQFRHKLEVLKVAMEDFDEVVFLDWDTLPVAQLPENFWEKMHEKDSFQSPLIQYKRRKASWRTFNGKKDTRKLCSASYIYLRDKELASDFIESWEELDRPWSEEMAISRCIDERNGGWQGVEHYWDHHEPHWFALPTKYWSYHPDRYRNDKERIFHHFDMNQMSPLVKKKKEEIDWIRYLQ